MIKLESTRACIVTVGTEVSSGEILNSNAKWLAQELSNLHIDVCWHLTVPDEENLIIDALDIARKQATLILVTGGLGPTTDDFTRNVVAEWANKKLVFDQNSWDGIVKRLNSINVPIAESNRQQCYFPENATIYANAAGTANAFSLKIAERTKLYCLPGPPTEIKTLWRDHIQESLKDLIPNAERYKLWYWHCMGISESQLGELVEKTISGSGYRTGYRPNIPYVTVKVWAPEGNHPVNDRYLANLDQALTPYTVTRQEEDLAAQLLDEVKGKSIHIQDELTKGLLSYRLGQALLTLEAQNKATPTLLVSSSANSKYEVGSLNHDITVILKLDSSQPNARIIFRHQNNQTSKVISYNRRLTADNMDRYRRFMVEMLLLETRKFIEELN